jgi:hypothetical protein
MNDLIASLKEGNEAALKEVMGMYKKPIYNYLSMLLGNRQLAEELTQDTFVKVYFRPTLKTDQPQACRAWICSSPPTWPAANSAGQLRKIFSLSELNESQVSYHAERRRQAVAEQLLAIVPENGACRWS